MKRQRIWIYGSVALAGIWVLAAAGMWFARSHRMTAEKVQAYLDASALASRNEAQRREVIDGLADRVNRLSFEERQKFRLDHSLHKFYEQMTDAERSRYLDRTLSKGMHQVMEAFNQMPPQRRKRLVDQAVNELKRIQTDTNREEIEKALADENVKKIMEAGMKSYMSEANASSKLDAQPVIEQIQNIVQEAR
jgi:hypothetical protein